MEAELNNNNKRPPLRVDKKKIKNLHQNKIRKKEIKPIMNRQCICDYSSEEYSEDKKGEKTNVSNTNRIFLNFAREHHHPTKNRQNQIKVKELFKYLQERHDLQEMKVSGWSGNSKIKKNAMSSRIDPVILTLSSIVICRFRWKGRRQQLRGRRLRWRRRKRRGRR